MVDTQHFCLRWNNYQSSITSAFENLRDDEDFVDVTLACDGKSLKAHRVVLSACSPYFRELLKSTPCKHPVIVLQDVAFTDLHALVEFIYHGEVNVHQRSLTSFLKTAEVLRVSGLTQQHGDEKFGNGNGLGPAVSPTAQSQAVQQQAIAVAAAQQAAAATDLPVQIQQQRQTPPQTTTPTQIQPPNNVSNNSNHSNSNNSEPSNNNTIINSRVRLTNNNHLSPPASMLNHMGGDCRSPQHSPISNSNGFPPRPPSLPLALGLKERRMSLDDLEEQKRIRSEHYIINNNTQEQLTPTDFSPTAIKNSLLAAMHRDRLSLENNGLDSSSHSPNLFSPKLHRDLISHRPNNNDEDVKNEPMDASLDLDNNSNDSLIGEDSNDKRGSRGGRSSSHCSNGEHEEHDLRLHPAFLSASESKLFGSESKLFATAAGSFNFSMAALTGDHSLAGKWLSNPGMQGGPENLAGTSQGPLSSPPGGFRMPPPTSGGINEPQECPYCRRTFSCYYSLKRHFQDKHERSDTLYVCEFCHRRYRTKNSLTTHKSLQHRGTSGMLRRLLKTTGVKNAVLGGVPVSHPPIG